MRRLLAVFTAVALLFGCLAACRPADTSQVISSQTLMSASAYSAPSASESVESLVSEQSSGQVSQPASSASSMLSSVESEITSSKASSKVSSETSEEVPSPPYSEATSEVSSSPAVSSVSAAVSPEASSAVSSASSSLSDPGIALSGEMRGVWVSFYELSDIKTFEIFKARFDGIIADAERLGFNAIFMHVRSHGDAFYRSAIFPMTARIGFTDSNGDPIQGVDPGYDPLEYAVSAAHAAGLQLHAWINPYRVWTLSGDITDLAKNNPARVIVEDGDSDNDEAVIIREGSIFYNPASELARGIIISGITEVIRNYAVDGVHFDDYFYPTTSASFDKSSYDAYLDAGGRLSLDDWRRDNVNKLVEGAYSAVKAVRDIPFGISPAGNIERVVNEEYADVRLWGSSAGYVDYLCPQVYWGFEHKSFPFVQTCTVWLNVISSESVKIYIGLPAYKLGQTDSGAGSGSAEFKTGKAIIARMVDSVRTLGCDGFVVYNMESIASGDNAAEANAFIERMK